VCALCSAGVRGWAEARRRQTAAAAAGRAWRWLDGSGTLISFTLAGQQCACSLAARPLACCSGCTGSNGMISAPFYGQCRSAGRLTEKGTALEQQAWHSDRPQAWAVDGVKQLSSSSSHPNQRLLLPEQMLRCRARAGDQASTGAEQEQDTCLQIVSCCGQCALPVLMRCSECVGVCVCARVCVAVGGGA
jgi:hypothetical protein